MVDNNRISEIVETTDEWIVGRTGISTRRIATTESTLDFATEASSKALGIIPGAEEMIDKDSIDLVIVTSVTPDDIVPCMAAQLKKRLGLTNAVAFDINAACSGFIYSAWVAESLMKNQLLTMGSKTNKIVRAVVVGAERLTRITNWEDRGTCVLFGDGAGAAVLEYNPDRLGIMASCIRSYDDTTDCLTCGLKYDETPFAKEPEKVQNMYMNGGQVFKFAVKALVEVMADVLEKTGLTADDIKYIVPHQANIRIISYAAKKFKQPIEKFYMCIDHTGNVSTASVPMALDELMQTGEVKSGDKLLLVAFGGGLSAAAMLYEVH